MTARFYDICFDTEFWTFGNQLHLISIGAVKNDASDSGYYAEVAEFDWDKVPEEDWLQFNVRPHLLGGTHRIPAAQICEELAAFAPVLTTGERPRFWAYYGAYDWTALCMLYGGFRHMPERWQKYFWELQTYRNLVDPDIEPPKKFPIEHNALQDAMWNLKFLRKIQALELHPMYG